MVEAGPDNAGGRTICNGSPGTAVFFQIDAIRVPASLSAEVSSIMLEIAPAFWRDLNIPGLSLILMTVAAFFQGLSVWPVFSICEQSVFFMAFSKRQQAVTSGQGRHPNNFSSSYFRRSGLVNRNKSRFHKGFKTSRAAKTTTLRADAERATKTGFAWLINMAEASLEPFTLEML